MKQNVNILEIKKLEKNVLEEHEDPKTSIEYLKNVWDF